MSFLRKKGSALSREQEEREVLLFDGLNAIPWYALTHAYGSNDELVFRVPRSLAEIEAMEREIALLRAFQGRLPLPIPNPQYVNEGTREVGRAFMGYAKLPGKPLYKEMLASVDGEEVAQESIVQIVSFLATLHHFPLDELAPLALPRRHNRDEYVALYARIREVLFPYISPEARERTIASFEAFLDTTNNFSLTPTLIHGNFEPTCILYKARDRSLSGSIDFSQTGSGDPASDFGRLLGPQGYGLSALQRCEHIYPGLSTLYARMPFYAHASFLQNALSRMEQKGRQSTDRFANMLTFFPQ
jgi:aminoglycoside 2''-phosphotransferase